MEQRGTTIDLPTLHTHRRRVWSVGTEHRGTFPRSTLVVDELRALPHLSPSSTARCSVGEESLAEHLSSHSFPHISCLKLPFSHLATRRSSMTTRYSAGEESLI